MMRNNIFKGVMLGAVFYFCMVHILHIEISKLNLKFTKNLK